MLPIPSVTDIRSLALQGPCVAWVLVLMLAVGPAGAGTDGMSPPVPEAAIFGMSLVPNAERLQVNTSPARKMIVALTRDQALMQIRALADRLIVEEQWAFLADRDLWVELGVNESADETGSQVEIDRTLLASLIAESDRLDLYHFHPRYYFEQLGGGIDFALAIPAAALTNGQLEAVGLALPSPSDVNATIEVAILAESVNPSTEIRHFVVSTYGVVAYGPTAVGQRKLAGERGYPLASLQRELEVAATLRRGALGMANASRAKPGLTVPKLLVELCRQMSSEMYFMHFEPHTHTEGH